MKLDMGSVELSGGEIANCKYTVSMGSMSLVLSSQVSILLIVIWGPSIWIFLSQELSDIE